MTPRQRIRGCKTPGPLGGSFWPRAACRSADAPSLPPPPRRCRQIMWLLYEQPDTRFDGVAMRFMDIRKRVYELPKLGAKADMVCIPTTSGTGSEVTPFSVVTDDVRGGGGQLPLGGGAVRACAWTTNRWC